MTLAGMPTIGGLSKWEELGKPRLVAELLKQRRDADAAGGAQVESVVLPGIKVEGDVLQVRVAWRGGGPLLFPPFQSAHAHSCFCNVCRGLGTPLVVSRSAVHIP